MEEYDTFIYINLRDYIQALGLFLIKSKMKIHLNDIDKVEEEPIKQPIKNTKSKQLKNQKNGKKKSKARVIANRTMHTVIF